MAAPTLGDMLQAIGSPAEWGSIPVGSSLARAYLTVGQNGLTTATETKVNLVEEYDLGGNFASNKYTAPITGYYQVNYCTYMQSDGGTLVAGLTYLYKDGVAIRFGAYVTDANGQIISPGSDIIYMVAGTYLELYALGITSSSTWKITATTAGTFMSVHLISRG